MSLCAMYMSQVGQLEAYVAQLEDTIAEMFDGRPGDVTVIQKCCERREVRKRQREEEKRKREEVEKENALWDARWNDAERKRQPK